MQSMHEPKHNLYFTVAQLTIYLGAAGLEM